MQTLADYEADVELVRKYIMDRSQEIPWSGCWLWDLSVSSNGYGNAYVGKKVVTAHRLSFMAFHGGIPDGGMVLHSCDVRCCVNPDHLSVGSHNENMAQMAGRRVCKRPPGTRLTKDMFASMFEQLTGGVSQERVAMDVGVNTKTVWSYAQDMDRLRRLAGIIG